MVILFVTYCLIGMILLPLFVYVLKKPHAVNSPTFGELCGSLCLSLIWPAPLTVLIVLWLETKIRPEEKR